MDGLTSSSRKTFSALAMSDAGGTSLRVHFVEHVEVVNDGRELSAEFFRFLFGDSESDEGGDVLDSFGVYGLGHWFAPLVE